VVTTPPSGMAGKKKFLIKFFLKTTPRGGDIFKLNLNMDYVLPPPK